MDPRCRLDGRLSEIPCRPRFDETVARRSVRAFEGGSQILGLEVPVMRDVHTSHQPMLGYTSHDGVLLEFETRAYAYERMTLGGRGVYLRAGQPPGRHQSAELGVDEHAIATLSWISGRLMISGRPTGRPRSIRRVPG